MSSFRQISFDSQVVQDTLAAVKSLVKEANISEFIVGFDYNCRVNLI